MMRNMIFCLASIVAVTLGQSSSGNIYGYDYDSNALANGPFLVQNPNYQFLNNALASEYAKTYQEEQQQADAAYYASTGSSSGASSSSGSSGVSSGTSGTSSSSNNGQIPVSTSYVPANGYYYGSVLTNAQQNAINYQQITQANPSSSSSSSTGSGSSNIYGYNYGSSSGGSSNTYNNQQMYSASSSSGSTATPYIYPFGQYSSSSSSSSSNNQVLRDSSSTGTSGTSGSVPSDVGLSYSLFYNDQTATPAYQSQSDLKTTTLRDQALPSNVRLQGAGPMPGPTLGSSSTLTQQFNDAGSNAYYYGNANSNTNTGSARVKFSSYPTSTRFFDVAGNQTEMYYPYRTSTNYNVQSNSASSGTSGSSGVTGASGSTTFYDSLPTGTSNADKCKLSDPYWCADYVNVFTSSKRTYSSDSSQTICTELVASLAESYNGCCTAVRGAGCSM